MASTSEAKRYNLTRLTEELKAYGVRLGLDNGQASYASRLSADLFLAHSTVESSFESICTSNMIVPAAERARAEGWTLPPDCAEVVLGTAGCNFFFAAPFRYPRTTCGFLFAPSLELVDVGRDSATPFDSGGLLNYIRRPDPSEPVQAFLGRHEIPVPAHRQYLALAMTILFEEPSDYVEGRSPRYPGPLDLTGGDQRRWTHEVRTPSRVEIRGSGHLKAVFAPRVLFNSRLGAFEDWCDFNEIEVVRLRIPQDGRFEVLRDACLDYIRSELYSDSW